MMNLAVLALVLSLSSQALSTGQPAVVPFGFSMKAPDGWRSITAAAVVGGLSKLKLTPEQLRTLVESQHGSVPVMAYVKYGPTDPIVLNPKIQVELRENPAKTFKQFLAIVASSAAGVKTTLQELEVTDPATEVVLGGKRAVRFALTFRLDTKVQGTMRVRTRVYAVPTGGTFFQITFTDGVGEDCATLFDEIAGTIRFE